ncbi:MAG: hypothetical protein NC433_16345 [Clostridiales bacterium]|nr:hypothetical protein [Clostridiales bacterium]
MEETKLSAKKREKKVFITDIAIAKVPLLQYKGLSDMENEALYQLAKLVLLTSQTENNSNEVAITCTLDTDNPLERIGISFGNEHEVDICADTASNHLILSAKRCVVVVLHNHPSTQTLSIEDIRFFLHFESVKVMVVVTNQGIVHYLCKDDEYDYLDSVELYKECIAGLTSKSKRQEYYMAGLTFLARCSEVGQFYH